MRHQFSLLMILCLGAAGALRAQNATPEQQPETMTAAQKAGHAPTDADIYCAGFFTRSPIGSDLVVLGGVDNGLRFEFADRDIVYLNQGAEVVKAPGGKYMLLRPIKDMNPTQPFPGQRDLVSQMGTLYAEVARIQVNIVHKNSSTAEILNSCEPVVAGDIAVPLAARLAPPYKEAKLSDRFAPSSGKATGMVAAIKEFMEAGGRGDVVYLNIGGKQNIHPGDYLRIFRTYQSPSQYIVQRGTRQYLTQIMGVPIGHKLTPEEIDSLPRTVVGEMMILSAQEETSTGIITYSWQDIYPGDQAEVE